MFAIAPVFAQRKTPVTSAFRREQLF